jgi:uncharacterized protein YggT (Ycf19 family)
MTRHIETDAADDTHVVERERVIERPVGSTNANVATSGTYVAGPGPLDYARRLLSLLFGVLAALLILRIVLLVLVANQANALVDFIYTVSEPFVAPFRGILLLDQVSPGGPSVLDVSALVALIGWFLIYLLIMAILGLGSRNRVTAA